MSRRTPWSVRPGTDPEEFELFSQGAEGAAEIGVEETVIDIGAESTFLSIEAAAAGLDTTGIGAPIGIAIGGLAALGFGTYEIYKYFKSDYPDLNIHQVNKQVLHAHKQATDTNNKIPYRGKATQKHLDAIKEKITAHHNKNYKDFQYSDSAEGSNFDYDLISNRDKSGLTIPGSNYIGPGNSLNRGPGTSQVDDDAHQHDHAYDQAKNFKDIQEADRTLLQQTGDHIIEGISGSGSIKDTVHGIIAGGGIAIKSAVENTIGRSIYPSMSDVHMSEPLKRPGTSTGGSDPKSQKVEADSTSQIQGQVQDGMANLPGTGAPQAGGSSGGAIFEYTSPETEFGRKITTYRKQHKLMSFGLTSDGISAASNTDPTVNLVNLVTPLAEIPWNRPVFYLTQNEFNLIPPGSFVKEVMIEVIYRKSTVQFNTNNTTTQEAVLNQLTDVVCAEALNKTGYGANVRPTTFETGNTMKVTGISRPVYSAVGGTQSYRGMVADFYGSAQGDTNFLNFQPKHQLGNNCVLRNYFSLSTINGSTATIRQSASGGWPNIISKCRQYNGDTINDTTVLAMTYQPKMGMLKEPLKYRPIGDPFPLSKTVAPFDNQIIPTVGSKGNFFIVSTERGVNGSGQPVGPFGNVKVSDVTNTPSTTVSNIGYDIYTPLEKSQACRTGFWGEGNSHVQPSAHIGVMPIPALNSEAIVADDNATKYTTTRGYFICNATMVVQEYQPTNYPFGDSTGAALTDVPYGDQIITVDDANLLSSLKAANINMSIATKGGLLPLGVGALPALS
nr:MAG: capsid protein [Chemarfal virus 64]